MKHHLTRIIAIILAASCVILTGCTGMTPTETTAEPTKPVTTDPTSPIYPPEPTDVPKAGLLSASFSPAGKSGRAADEAFKKAYNDFAAKLFSSCADGKENVMISPLSVMLALAMTANGADGITLDEMQTLLGGDIPLDVLNEYLLAYVNSLPSDEKAKFGVANSIWVREGEINVKPDFLQRNADYYGADVYSVPFTEETVREINNWVKAKTDSMIPEIIDNIPPEAVMFLINAIVFDAKWERHFMTSQATDIEFTNADGSKTAMELMYLADDDSSTVYAEYGDLEGMVKFYSGGRYAFLALIPKDESTPLSSVLGSIDPSAAFNNAVLNANKYVFHCNMPRFEYEYEKELTETLMDLGMASAFSGADFSRIEENSPLYIGSVKHKTFISVGEEGTKAAAVTSVEVCKESCPMGEMKNVSFFRPFAYYIMDTETGMPIFMGTMASLK